MISCSAFFRKKCIYESNKHPHHWLASQNPLETPPFSCVVGPCSIARGGTGTCARASRPITFIANESLIQPGYAPGAATRSTICGWNPTFPRTIAVPMPICCFSFQFWVAFTDFGVASLKLVSCYCCLVSAAVHWLPFQWKQPKGIQSGPLCILRSPELGSHCLACLSVCREPCCWGQYTTRARNSQYAFMIRLLTIYDKTTHSW